MCNTTQNPFNRAYTKKLPPPESTFLDARPHILGTLRPYRTLFCCQSKIAPKKQDYLISTRATISILGITPHIYGYRWRRHPAIINDAAIAYTTTRLKNQPFMAPAKIEFLKMALPSKIGGVRLRLPLTDN